MYKGYTRPKELEGPAGLVVVVVVLIRCVGGGGCMGGCSVLMVHVVSRVYFVRLLLLLIVIGFCGKTAVDPLSGNTEVSKGTGGGAAAGMGNILVPSVCGKAIGACEQAKRKSPAKNRPRWN